MTRTMTGEDAVGSLCLDEFDLDDGRARLVDAGHTPARHRAAAMTLLALETMPCGRGSNVHLFS